jgi:hypothetical protein
MGTSFIPETPQDGQVCPNVNNVHHPQACPAPFSIVYWPATAPEAKVLFNLHVQDGAILLQLYGRQ